MYYNKLLIFLAVVALTSLTFNLTFDQSLFLPFQHEDVSIQIHPDRVGLCDQKQQKTSPQSECSNPFACHIQKFSDAHEHDSFCPCCGWTGHWEELRPFGSPPWRRDNASCPICNARERHRRACLVYWA